MRTKGAQVATGTTVFSRVTVVAPRTRIDVALPADVSVADLLPMLLEMSRETAQDGGARHGGWCLAKLGDAPLDPSRTLASLGVVDGELLQLRRRAENPPAPLYDDVVDAIAEAEPASFRPWTKETARRIGHVAGALALVVSSVTLLLGGLNPAFHLAAAIVGAVATIACVAVGATVARGYAAPTTGVIIAAAGGLPLAFVAGMNIVPGPQNLRPAMLLGSALVVVVAAASIMLIGTGITTFIAGATAGLFGAVAFTVATIVPGQAPAGIAAGAAAVALAGVSALPRVTIQLAKLPLPTVPSNAEDLKEDTGFPDFAVIERRAGIAHDYMTGMIIGCGAVASVSAVIAAAAPSSATPVFGAIMAVVVAAVLLLRARSYANSQQAVALQVSGIVAAAGVFAGWLATASPLVLLLFVFGTLVLVAAAALVLGVVFPDQKFSPPLRRTVDIIEAILIAAVLPLSLAVMNLYTVLRHLNTL